MATAQAELMTEPKTHMYSVEEYYQMTELGFFNGKRVELIEGEVVEMSAMGRPHVWAVKRTAKLLEGIFEPGWFVQSDRRRIGIAAGQTGRCNRGGGDAAA